MISAVYSIEHMLGNGGEIQLSPSPNRGTVSPQSGEPRWRQLLGRPSFPGCRMLQKTAIGLHSQLSYLPDAACPSTTSLSSDVERRTYPKLLKPGGTLTLRVSGLKVCNQTRPLSPYTYQSTSNSRLIPIRRPSSTGCFSGLPSCRQGCA